MNASNDDRAITGGTSYEELEERVQQVTTNMQAVVTALAPSVAEIVKQLTEFAGAFIEWILAPAPDRSLDRYKKPNYPILPKAQLRRHEINFARRIPKSHTGSHDLRFHRTRK